MIEALNGLAQHTYWFFASGTGLQGWPVFPVASVAVAALVFGLALAVRRRAVAAWLALLPFLLTQALVLAAYLFARQVDDAVPIGVAYGITLIGLVAWTVFKGRNAIPAVLCLAAFNLLYGGVSGLAAMYRLTRLAT